MRYDEPRLVWASLPTHTSERLSWILVQGLVGGRERELSVILLWPNFRHLRSSSPSLPSHACLPTLPPCTYCIWRGGSRL